MNPEKPATFTTPREPTMLDIDAASKSVSFSDLLPWQKRVAANMMARRRKGDMRTPEQHAEALLQAQAKRDRKADKLEKIVGTRGSVLLTDEVGA